MPHDEAGLIGWADALGYLLEGERAVRFWGGAEGAWFGFEGFEAEGREGLSVVFS
jgi:hypothetical protein